MIGLITDIDEDIKRKREEIMNVVEEEYRQN